MVTTRQAEAGMTLELRRISPATADRVGVKAANQASLLRAGFPVPEGVVITADAYTRFSDGEAIAASTPEPETAATPPTEMRKVLQDVVTILGDIPLAVRSSGVAEDLPAASFAGQYETVLNVEGLDRLEDAVRRCWASAASTHATAYRDTHGLHDGSMAVLVQRMVDADAAGVAFSANPVTGQRQEVVINAVPGLGDKLVSGDMSPDQWVVRGDEARCEASQHEAIDTRQAMDIAHIARRVEAHFGSPQDIEWAIADGQLHLLQARPITALPEPTVEPIPVDVEVPPGFWFLDTSHGNSHVPIDRFLMELVRPCSARWFEEFGYLLDGIEFRLIGGWPYQRMIPPGDREGPALPGWLMRLLVRVVPDLRKRVARSKRGVRSDLPGRYVERWHSDWQPEMARSIARLRDIELAELPDDDLRRHTEEARELMSQGLLIHMRLAGAQCVILYDLVRTCEELLGWDTAQSMDLVSGTSHKSTEPARRLRVLADMADGRPQVRNLFGYQGDDILDRLAEADGEFADSFATYLREYMCRGLGHTTLSEPTLAEMPALVLTMISGQLERGYDPDLNLEEGARRRSETLRTAEALLADRPKDLERLRRVVARAERAYPVREDNEFFCFSSPLALLRYAALEIGRRLVARGVVDVIDDVLFLELDEALAALAGEADERDLVRRRRAEQAWIEGHPGPPSYGTAPPGPPSFGFLPREARTMMESLLWVTDMTMAVDESNRAGSAPGSDVTGMAASPGEYTGSVRVIMDESRLEDIGPGDVLVCPTTSPVWSVVFPVIGALVTDTGGLLSHPAIIAREYQIPAVVATGNATARLADGEVVTVNGSTGTVSIGGSADGVPGRESLH